MNGKVIEEIKGIYWLTDIKDISLDTGRSHTRTVSLGLSLFLSSAFLLLASFSG